MGIHRLHRLHGFPEADVGSVAPCRGPGTARFIPRAFLRPPHVRSADPHPLHNL